MRGAARLGIATLSGVALVILNPPLVEQEVDVSSVLQETVTFENISADREEAVHTEATTSLLFVGDIMLGRAVESRMEYEGIGYPFSAVVDTLGGSDITVGNFEGVVTETHIKTPPYTFQFSIKSEYLEHLNTVGFDVLSLANNHTLDYGTTSLAYTRSLCAVYDLICGGTPKGLSEVSTKVVAAGGHTVGIMFIHTLYGAPAPEALRTTVEKLSTESDIQIAYVHWGDEYVLVHNTAQELFAQTLIDAGVDAVIGHHPHVVQDIALYKGKPIFYSLGNFIFDQYFSDDVQEMVGVHLTLSGNTATYKVVPFTSKETRNQPHHMDAVNATLLKNRIFAPIAMDSGVDSVLGIITTTY
jgi:gamma-polyglutamate biosynthesis protein CapA